MTKTTLAFAVAGADFTVRAMTGYDQYLINAGWRSDIMLFVARANGYEVTKETLGTVPIYLLNMAIDFSQLMLTTTIDGEHPLAGVDITTGLTQAKIEQVWPLFIEVFRDDEQRDLWLNTFSAVNKVDTDPKGE